VRTVGVKLEAETAQYERNMAAAAKVTTEADRAADKLAATSVKTGRAADDLGGDFRDTGRDAQRLKNEIQSLEKSLAGLATEFTATSNAADRMDLTKTMRRQQGELRQLLKVQNLLPDPDPKVTQSWGRKMMVGVSGGLQSAASSSLLLTAGAVVGVALAPSIAAGIGAGIAAGAGAAGIAGGIALVAKDPLVAAAGKDIGTRFAAGVTAEAQTFRQPVLNALNQIDQAASRTVPKIGQIFRNTAPSVDRLTGSLIRAGDAITDGLVAASSRSAGPLAAIGDLVENVGTAFGHTIDVLSQRSPEGVSAINDLSNAATNAVRTMTGLLDGIARIKGGLDSFDKGIDSARYGFEDFVQKMTKGQSAFDITADGYRVGSEAAELYRKGVIGINGSLNDYDHYMGKASTATHTFIMDTYKADPPTKALVISLNNAEKAALGERSALVGLSNQLRGQADPVFALIEAQKNLKTAQDKAAEATKNHGHNSKEARQATRDLALAAIDLQGKVGALGDKFTGKLTPAMHDTLKAGGLTESQIRDVARQFRDAKRDGDKYAKKYQADARLTGGSGVSTKLKILGEMQAALASGTKPASYYGNLNRQLLQARMATGGPVQGYSPHKTADNIPIMATAREFMQPVDAVDYYGVPAMEAIRKRQVPREVLAGFSTGRLGRMGDLPFFATGGLVWPYRVTASHTRVPSWKEAASKVPGGSAGAFIRAQAGKPYIWASAGPRGYDCCVRPTTMVYGPDKPKEIQFLQSGDRVYAFEDGKIVTSTVNAAWMSKVQPIFRVQTRNRDVYASANHPFLRLTEVRETATSRGLRGDQQTPWGTEWVRLDELKRGDYIVTFQGTDDLNQSGDPFPEDMAWFLGLYVGDGCFNSDAIRLCVFGEIRDRATEIVLKHWGRKAAHHPKAGMIINKASAVRWMREQGFEGRSHEKRLPSIVWTWDAAAQEAFLAGYGAADGWVPKPGCTTHADIVYKSTSEGLMRDLRALHTKLGHGVTIIRKQERTKPIFIAGVEVKNALPIYGFSVTRNNRAAAVRTSGRLPQGAQAELATWDPALGVQPILDITPAGVEETWDINVEGSHNFVADGVVVHNSGIVSAVYNVLHGRNPYSHTFSTGSLPGHWFPKPGVGGPLTAAWSHPGQYPASSSTGHMMGMAGGLTFESSGSRGVHLGSSTRRLTDFAHIAHYNRGGLVMDDGGALMPGWNPPIYNGTGRPEHVIPERQIGGGAGRGVNVTYQVNVSAAPLTHPAEIGRVAINYIQAYEKNNGDAWRNGP
jgi:hypothetical protein